jgi:hypothetical protein
VTPRPIWRCSGCNYWIRRRKRDSPPPCPFCREGPLAHERPLMMHEAMRDPDRLHA